MYVNNNICVSYKAYKCNKILLCLSLHCFQLNVMAEDAPKWKYSKKSWIKMLLQVVAIIVAFLPDCRPILFPFDEEKETTKAKHTEVDCATPFNEVMFANLTLTCFSCYKRNKMSFESCRSNCFSTIKYEECIKKSHPSSEEYYLKLANKYNRREIFPFMEKDDESKCPAPFEKKTFAELSLTCFSCYYRQSDTDELESCRAECFSTSKFEDCINETYVDKEYYLNLSNTINKRIVFPLEVTEEVPIISPESFKLKMLDIFSLEHKEFTSKKHEELNCTSPFRKDKFTLLSLACFLCYGTYSKEDFQSCRWECFSTLMYQDCIRKIHPSNEEYFFKLANDYNQRTVQPVTSSEEYQVITIDKILSLDITDQNFSDFSLQEYEVTQLMHKAIGCTSQFKSMIFYGLTFLCNKCHNSTKVDFNSCRWKCFNNTMYHQCVETLFPPADVQRYLDYAKLYNKEVVHPEQSVPVKFIEPQFEQFTINKDVESSIKKHEELGCTSQYDEEKFYNLTLICHTCHHIKPNFMFELCRSECFSSIHYIQCVVQFHPSDYREHYFNLTNDYNGKTIWPLSTYHMDVYLTYDDFTKYRHDTIGCASPFIENVFYNLTVLCFTSFGAPHMPRYYFDNCRSKCFSTNNFRDAFKNLPPTRANEYLKLANDYNQKEVHALMSSE